MTFSRRMRSGAAKHGGERRERRERRPPTPLDAARLEERALAYVARFATTRAKLNDYLKRKLAERGWAAGDDGDPSPDMVVAALVERFCAAGYVDDAAYARAKSGSLLRRGYGERRVSQALGAAGIDADTRAELAPADSSAREAALTLARKRRFGPFDQVEADRPRREKQLAAMLRAGHPLDLARAVLNAGSIAEAEAWAYGDGDHEEER